MTTKAIEKLVHNLSREVITLRSFVISVIRKDKEGAYKSSFVKDVLKKAKDEPNLHFTNSKDFLSKLKNPFITQP